MVFTIVKNDDHTEPLIVVCEDVETAMSMAADILKIDPENIYTDDWGYAGTVPRYMESLMETHKLRGYIHVADYKYPTNGSFSSYIQNQPFHLYKTRGEKIDTVVS